MKLIVALPVQQHVLRAMPRDGGEAHLLEQPAHRLRIGRRVLDEFEPVGAERVVPQVAVRCGCHVGLRLRRCDR